MFEMHADTEVLAVSSAAALSSLRRRAAARALDPRAARPPAPTRRPRSPPAISPHGRPSSGPAEVAEVAHAFNAMADSIERLFEARRELVAWASHDLRTPLASMQAMIEAIDDGLAEPRRVPAVARPSRCGRSPALVDDLFELARIDAGVLTHQIEQADLRARHRLVRARLRGRGARARASGSRRRARGQVPPVRCAPDQVQRVLYNLLDERDPPHPAGRRDRDRRQPTACTTSRSPSRTPARA